MGFKVGNSTVQHEKTSENQTGLGAFEKKTVHSCTMPCISSSAIKPVEQSHQAFVKIQTRSTPRCERAKSNRAGSVGQTTLEATRR